MNTGNFINILGGMVVVAGIATLVASQNTANIIIAFGRAFAGSLTAAQGGKASF